MKQKLLSKIDLISELENGCKPITKWKIGTEHEKFAYDKKSLKPIQYEKIKLLFLSLTKDFSWEKVFENEKLIGLKKNGSSITLEPGGQIELSGAPVENLFQTCQQVNTHKNELKDVSDSLNIDYMGMGVLPKWNLSDIPIMPKKRYEIMRDHMKKVGTHGLDMMLRTCTIQANLDFDSESDMVKKMRVALAIQPAIIALYANSPFVEGKLTDFCSYRSMIWTKTDDKRCGFLPFVYDKGFSFESYVDYLLDVPMYFVKRNDAYINCAGESFKDFMNGKLPSFTGEFPTLIDWNDHMTVSFPEVRLKKFLEVRGADGGPWSSVCALPAFWTGILYDKNVLDEVWDLVKKWDIEQKQTFYLEVARNGLKSRCPENKDIKDLLKRLLDLSKSGLKKRKIIIDKKDESFFLDPLYKVLKSKKSPAEKWNELFLKKWNKDLDKIYEINFF